MLYKHTMVWQHNITLKCLFSLFSSSIQKIVWGKKNWFFFLGESPLASSSCRNCTTPQHQKLVVAKDQHGYLWQLWKHVNGNYKTYGKICSNNGTAQKLRHIKKTNKQKKRGSKWSRAHRQPQSPQFNGHEKCQGTTILLTRHRANTWCTKNNKASAAVAAILPHSSWEKKTRLVITKCSTVLHNTHSEALVAPAL